MLKKIVTLYRYRALTNKVLIIAKLNLSSRIYDKLFFWLPYRAVLILKTLTRSQKNLKKLQSQIYLIRANKDQEANKKKRAIKNLKIALHLLGADLTSEYKKYLISEYQFVLSHKDQHESVSDRIARSTKNEIESGNISDGQTFYYLSKFLNWCGFLNAGFLARDKSVSISQSISLDCHSGEKQFELKCSALIERGDITQAHSLLRTFKSKIRTARFNQFNFHLNLLSRTPKDYVTSGINDFYDSEVRMSELIKGKSVALIGTGVPQGDYGDEIESYDLVVRVKYAGHKSLPPRRKHGARCDISFVTTIEPFEIASDMKLSWSFLWVSNFYW